MKFWKSLTIVILGLVLTAFPQSVLAAFSPQFGFDLANPAPSANSNITFVVNQPTAGETGFKKVTVQVPAGFDFNPSSEVGENEIVGDGYFTAGLSDGTTYYNTPLTIFNDLQVSGSQKVHWVFLFNEAIPPIDVYITGDISSGHSFSLEFPSSVLPLPTPIFFNFTIFGFSSTSGKTIVSNPIVGGLYTWITDFISANNETFSYQFGISFPGESTSVGSNVEVTFGTTAVTFSEVSSNGTTTVTTTSAVPAEGTGQFQVSDGLYYDIRTSEGLDYSCPCTITLPYDPKTVDKPSIYHLEGGVWVDVTTGVDAVNHLVTGVVSSLSFFAGGQPNFGLEFLDPVRGLLEVSNPMRFDRNRTLPVNFTLTDSNGDFMARDDVKIQVVNNTTNVLVGEISAVALKKHYKANLDLALLNLPNGTYKLRVKVGNTTSSPTPLFNPV